MQKWQIAVSLVSCIFFRAWRFSWTKWSCLFEFIVGENTTKKVLILLPSIQKSLFQNVIFSQKKITIFKTLQNYTWPNLTFWWPLHFKDYKIRFLYIFSPAVLSCTTIKCYCILQKKESGQMIAVIPWKKALSLYSPPNPKHDFDEKSSEEKS